MTLIDELMTYVQEHETTEIIRTNLIRFFGVDETYDLKQLQNLYESAEYNELDKPLFYFEECIEDIRANYDHYKRVYENYLADNQSKDVFIKMLYAKVFMDVDFIKNAYSDDSIYFSESIWGELRPEAYIDCGGYIGDTTLQYIIRRPDYSSIYVYEPLKEAYDQCCNELSFYVQEENVKIFPYAICEKEIDVSFAEGNKSGDSKISSAGTKLIPGIALDHAINEPVGFIKMDIEGSEKEAILGTKNIIQKYQPQMAICIYHLKDDFWKVPQTILEICPEYRFKIRQHDPQAYSETVLYCIPPITSITFKTVDDNFQQMYERINKAISKLNILSKEDKQKNIDIKNSKSWWLSQLRYLSLDNKKLRKWAEELEVGKAWLEQKREQELAIIQRDNEIYNDLQSWIHQLEIEKQELKDQIEHLENYIRAQNESK